MTDETKRPRQTLGEMASQADGQQPMQIAGKPAVVCPYCGCGMFAYRTDTLQTRIVRYERCRNPSCGKRFITKQGHAEIVREIED